MVFLLLVGACTGDPAPPLTTHETGPWDDPQVIPSPEASEGVGTGSDLYVVDPTTGAIEPILVRAGQQGAAERSPDGARLVYQSVVPGGATQIFVLEEDGTELQLTDLLGGAEEPTWSPDGSQIAFAAPYKDALATRTSS